MSNDQNPAGSVPMTDKELRRLIEGRFERFANGIAAAHGVKVIRTDLADAPACGPCADSRNLVLTAGFPAEPCKFCGGPTGRRLAVESP